MSDENTKPEKDATANTGESINTDAKLQADGSTPESEMQPPTEEKAEPAVEEEKSIEEELAEDLEDSETQTDPEAVQSETPAPAFDLKDIINNPELMRELKAAIAETPDRPDHKAGDKKVNLRRIDGKYVIDFKNSYSSFAMNEAGTQKVEKLMIPVKFHNEEEFVDVDYQNFIEEGERVPCKVLKSLSEAVPTIEGETYDEHGRLVDMVRTEHVFTFEIVTPEGEEITIHQKVANA